MNSDDADLVRMWRGGDAEARAALFERHYGRVHRFFDVKLPSVSDDLAQQTFVACDELIERLERPERFKAFLFGIARNHLLRHLRSSGRVQGRTSVYKTAAGDRTSPSGIVARREEQWLVLRGMEKLPTDLRIALEMFYWEDMSSAEIAEVLRVPVSTVTTRISRARGRLRDLVDGIAAPDDRLIDTELDRWARSLAQGPGNFVK